MLNAFDHSRLYLSMRRPLRTQHCRRVASPVTPFLVDWKVDMLGVRCGLSAGEPVKSQRNSKELSKSVGGDWPHGASPSVPADARPAGLSGSGEVVATVYEIGPFRLDPGSGVLMRARVWGTLDRAVQPLTVLVQNAPTGHQRRAHGCGVARSRRRERLISASRCRRSDAFSRKFPGASGGWRRSRGDTGYRTGYRIAGAGCRRPGSDQLGICLNRLTSFVGREHDLVEAQETALEESLLTLARCRRYRQDLDSVQLAGSRSEGCLP